MEETGRMLHPVWRCVGTTAHRALQGVVRECAHTTRKRGATAEETLFPRPDLKEITHMHTRFRFIPIAALILTAAIAGCAKQSPSENQADVAKAQSAGEKSVADARSTASEQMIDARKELADKQADVAHTGAVAGRNVTVAEAEAVHKVAIERCDSVSRDEKSRCKTLADTELAAAKADAEATKAIRDPKG
jgi:hypothetical protein